jgi:GTP-binding protein HflX
LIPYTSGELLNRIHKEGEVIEERFEEHGTYISAKCPKALADYIESANNID